MHHNLSWRSLLPVLGFWVAFLTQSSVRAQSVGYYPWNGLISVSTNSDKKVWCDFRFQTNTLFGSLGTEILPMINLKQKPKIQYYLGGGVRFNFIGVIANQTKNVIGGYQLNIGTRAYPFSALPNLGLAFEVVPYVERKFDTGVLKSNLGLLYRF